MFVCRRTLLLSLPVLAGALVGAEPAHLPPEQLAKAARIDAITIPTPSRCQMGSFATRPEVSVARLIH